MAEPTTIVVPAEAAGERLDRFLATHLGSRAAAERAVEAGALVDGLARPKSFRLEGGEEVAVQAARRPPEAVPPPPEPAIVWQDEHLLVVDKPAGLVVHPGHGHASGTLVDALAGKIAGGEPERPGIVHRLDRDTSGLMVVARSEEAHARLQELVRERALERTYLALVRGRPRSRTGRIEAPIGRDRGDADARLARHRHAARRDHALRGRAAVARARAAARAARDGADAPDPRPPRRDRPAGRRRPDLRRPGAPGSRASSCTRPSWRFRIRSPTSASNAVRAARRTSRPAEKLERGSADRFA